MAATADDPHAKQEIVVIGGWRRRAPSRPPRRWLATGACILLAVATVIIVVMRSHTAEKASKSDFRLLQSGWATATAVDAERTSIMGRLIGEATPTDVPAVIAAVLALQRQEAGRLAGLRAHVGAGGEADATLDALASAERAALGREIVDLQGAPLLVWSATAEVDIAKVQEMLTADMPAYGARPTGRPRPARLTAAEATLREFGRPLNDTVPARLLVFNGASLQVIDLADGRVSPAPAPLNQLLGSGGWPQGGGSASVLAAAGFLAFQTLGGVVDAISADLAGSPHQLGRIPMLPAAGSDAVWVGRGSQLVLVTGSGRRIAGPVPTLARPALGGSPGIAAGPSATGLAVTDGQIVQMDNTFGIPMPVDGLWLWNPLRGPALRQVVRGCAWPFAARGALLAWLSCSHRYRLHVSLHITDLTTGADRVIGNPRAAFPFSSYLLTAAFSPNGRWLAAYYARTWFGGNAVYAVGLVNVATGVTRVVPGATVVDPTQADPMLWTSDSTRLFFETGGGELSPDQSAQAWDDAAAPFATYRVGARTSVYLRFHSATASLIAVLPGS
jgi:hypothetical protein